MKRIFLLFLGWLCVGLAFVGIFVPGLPTTIFLPSDPTLDELVSFSNPHLKDVLRFPLPSPLIQLSTSPVKNASPPFSDKVRKKTV